MINAAAVPAPLGEGSTTTVPMKPNMAIDSVALHYLAISYATVRVSRLRFRRGNLDTDGRLASGCRNLPQVFHGWEPCAATGGTAFRPPRNRQVDRIKSSMRSLSK